MRRVLGDTLISALALLVLLTVLVSIDARVRDRVMGALRGDTVSAEFANVQSQAGQAAAILFDAAKYQTIENAPMMIFVVAATALVLAMMRL